MLILPLTVLLLAEVTTFDLVKMRAYSGYGPISRQPLWLQAIEIYVLVDFCAYWMHRLFHRGRWWPFHAVHHSSEELDWLGSLRVHPVNDLVNKLAQATPVLLLGFNPTVTLSTAPILTFYALFLHANVNWDFGPLRSVISTPVFHRWHHSREREAWDKNFAGLLPVWDILFGTYYMPKDRMPENFGICEPMPKGYLGQLWEPFAWLRRRGRKVDPM
jgi:sterol desaturase/sphingolipid hydroxylase (fatty acid hydroxylase superfamily)